MANRLKTVLLLGLLTGLIMGVGAIIGGRNGIVYAFIFAGLFNFFAYWFSDKIVLMMYRAKEITPDQAPRLFSLIQQLTQSAGLPMPRVTVVPVATPNAFATGRNPSHAVVAVTEGILKILDERELAGVIAHELSHVKDRDILVSSIAATMAGAIIMLARMAQWAAIFGGVRSNNDRDGGVLGFLFMIILAPIAAMLIQLAISRSREYLADEEGAKLVGNPNYLADALEKLEYAAVKMPLEANQATAHMFIVNPLRGRRASFFGKLFSTHPPTEERVRRLRAMKPTF